MTPHALASLLETDLEALVKLSRAAHRLYRPHPIVKKNGQTRHTWAPAKPLKRAQRLLCEKVLDRIQVPESLYGGPGTSHLAAAREHVAQPLVVTMDLEDFFPSVGERQVFAALLREGLPENTAHLIARLCTRRRVLPQGAPTSPTLARLVVTPALVRIAGALQKVSADARVTLYVDDLTFSGPPGIKRMIPLVTEIFRQSGFTVHPKKTKVMPASVDQEVLGLRVNRRLEVPEKFRERLKEATQTLGPLDPHVLGLRGWVRAVHVAN